MRLGRGGRERESDLALTFVGTFDYMAPEMFLSAKKRVQYDKSVDVWAAGMLFLVLVLDKFPWETPFAEAPITSPPDWKFMRNFYWRKAGCAHGDCVPGGGMELIEQCLTQVPPRLQSVLRAMLKFQPGERLSVSALLQMDAFAGVSCPPALSRATTRQGGLGISLENQDEQLEEVLLPCAKTYTSSASSALGPVALQDVAAKKDLARLPERLAEREGGGRFEKMAEEVYLAMTVTEEEWERMRWGGEMIPTEGSSTSNFWASLQTFCFGSCLCRDSDAQGKAEDEETQFRTVVGGPESRGLSAFQSVGGGSTVTD